MGEIDRGLVGDFATVFLKIYEAFKGSPPAATLSFVGLLFFLVTAYLVIRILRREPSDTRMWEKTLIFITLLLTVVFSAVGPATALFLTPAAITLKTTASEGLSNLRENKRVTWLIRLIAYDPKKSPGLSAGRVTHLGLPKQKYVFVGDYSELRGYTAAEAYRRLGDTITGQQHITAILFPVMMELYPANARGVIHIIDKLQSEVQPPVRNRLYLERYLSANDLRDLENTRLESYSWDRYSSNYERMCQAVQEFRCGEFDVKNLIGRLGEDWHPLGFSRTTHGNICGAEADERCKVSNWDTERVKVEREFGARVFLVENLSVLE